MVKCDSPNPEGNFPGIHPCEISPGDGQGLQIIFHHTHNCEVLPMKVRSHKRQLGFVDDGCGLGGPTGESDFD